MKLGKHSYLFVIYLFRYKFIAHWVKFSYWKREPIMNTGVLFLVCFILPWNATCFKFIEDYFFPRNPTVNRVRNIEEARGDEFAVLDTVGMVEKYGYSSDDHNITTLDDYNIIIFRIYASPASPEKQGKPVVFLQHGLFASSDTWVLFGPGKDLAFLLADEGYDVWIGNLRGNSYGRSHKQLSTRDPQFWSFSYHEHGVLDLPMMIDYILEYTNSTSLSYIGHSMGTTMAYVLLSEKPEYNEKMSIVVSLAPVAIWKEPPKTLTLNDNVVRVLQNIFDEHGIYELLPQTTYSARMARVLCSDGSFAQPFCKLLISILAGHDPDQLNSTAMPYIFSHFPAGGSTASLFHYYQNIKSGTFGKYDFGYAHNFRLYGKKKPPIYDLKKISAPVALIYGKGDISSFEKNVAELAKRLQNVVTFEAVEYENFNHFDFVWAKDAKELLYDRVISLLSMYSRYPLRCTNRKGSTKMKSQRVLLRHLLICITSGLVCAVEKNFRATFIREVRLRLTGMRNAKRVVDEDYVAFDTSETLLDSIKSGHNHEKHTFYEDSKVRVAHRSVCKYEAFEFVDKILTRLLTTVKCSSPNFFITNNDSSPFQAGLIKRHGYSVEEHTLRTEDGYFLRLFRMPGSPSSPESNYKPVVFLQHGVLWSSDAFVLMGPSHDLSFMLVDAGYDVWIGNVRGNTYCRTHQNKKPSDPKFWDFSYHEMGDYDLPSMIDHVLLITGQKAVCFVGHSMGATIAYVMLSLRPEYNSRIKLLVSLAPVTRWKHKLNAMQALFKQAGCPLQETLKRNEIYEILPQTTALKKQAEQWCNEDAVSHSACLNMIFGVVGEDREQLNSSLLPYLFSSFPAGTSLRTMAHFHQNILSGEFQQYDYGLAENFDRYKQREAPNYELQKVTAPVALFYGKNDAIVPVEEIYDLAESLSNVTILEAVPFRKFNHMDFIWARDVRELLYKRILRLIQQY
ncbi:uncharacterized protein [Venturia canescens]|uniref:uncharacterized protein n=1 Tax=Venturia canescens TaxID=32260 RepID=UPI001C9C5500|nr:uncharacterized protein LOC122407197 [Venturia canescens]